MAEAISESISFFRSQLEKRRYESKPFSCPDPLQLSSISPRSPLSDLLRSRLLASITRFSTRFGDAILRILESVLVAKDVRSLLETRSALRDLLRSEAISVVQEISQKTADEKLCVVEFFVRAFALVGDVESCLALKYEALVLRETKYLKYHGLQVSHQEWLTFAEDSLGNGFYAIAVKGFESALLCIQSNNNINPVTVTVEEQTVNKIKKLRDMATALVASHSVQTQSAEYLKSKARKEDLICGSCSSTTTYAASSMFRQGVKRRNMQKLYHSRAL